MASQIFFNIDNGHFKICGFDVFRGDKESQVITYYGRIGTPMCKLRKTTKTFQYYADAYDYAWNKINEKTQQCLFVDINKENST